MPVQIRHGSVTALAAQAPSPSMWMSGSECARASAIRAEPRRAQFIAGRWLARRLLAETLGGSWRDWTLTAEDDAPPRVSGPAPAALSISHSGDVVACAAGTVPVGIDVEARAPRRDLGALYDAITTDEERRVVAAHLDAGADSMLPNAMLQYFTHAWALKEACIKREGGGLFHTMLGHAVRIDAAADAARANACTWQWEGHVLALSAETASIAALTHSPTLSAFAGPRYWKLTRHLASR